MNAYQDLEASRRWAENYIGGRFDEHGEDSGLSTRPKDPTVPRSHRDTRESPGSIAVTGGGNLPVDSSREIETTAYIPYSETEPAVQNQALQLQHCIPETNQPSPPSSDPSSHSPFSTTARISGASNIRYINIPVPNITQTATDDNVTPGKLLSDVISAVKRGDASVVQELLQVEQRQHLFELSDEDGQNFFHHAIQFHDKSRDNSVLNALIGCLPTDQAVRHEIVNAVCNTRKTPLLLAVMLRRPPETFGILYHAGADVNKTGARRLKPLELADSKPYPEIIEVLINLGATGDTKKLKKLTQKQRKMLAGELPRPGDTYKTYELQGQPIYELGVDNYHGSDSVISTSRPRFGSFETVRRWLTH